MRIDDSGSGSWQAPEAVWSGVWGRFYLDAEAQLLIILALGPWATRDPVGTAPQPRTWAVRSPPPVPSPPGSDSCHGTGWAWAGLTPLQRLGRRPGHWAWTSQPWSGVGGILLYMGYTHLRTFQRGLSSCSLPGHLSVAPKTLSIYITHTHTHTHTDTHTHTHTETLHLHPEPGNLLSACHLPGTVVTSVV